MKETLDLNNNINKKPGFNDRIVRYEQIHKVKDVDYEALINAIDPQPGEVIFEGCAGYADISKHIIQSTENFDKKPELYILDESPVQIKRAKEELKTLPEDHIIVGDIRSTGMPDNKFDKVVIKMGLHELPKIEQEKTFNEMNRILKDGGKFVIWELSLNNKTQEIFQRVLRKKDELAGFDALVKNRYFQKHEELVDMFEKANFKDIKDEYKMRYVFNPLGRSSELVSKNKINLLKEKGVLSDEDEIDLQKLGKEKAKKLIAYIKEIVKTLPDEILKEIEYKDLGDDIEMTFDKIIMSGTK